MIPGQLSLDFQRLLEDDLTDLALPHDIFNKVTAENVDRFLENRFVERKDARINRTELAKYYSMFSNNYPHGGIIFLGVSDNGIPTGVKQLPQSELNRIEEFHIQLCPMAKPQIKRVEYHGNTGDNNFFLAILIPYIGQLVETNKNEAYMRYGENMYQMSHEHKIEFKASRNQIEFELGSVSLHWPNDFDADIIRNICDAFMRRENISDRTKEDVLAIRRLGDIKDGKFTPNKALALLAAKDARSVFPGCRVRIQRFEGANEGHGETYNPIVDKFVDGNVVQLIERSAAILDTIIYDFTYLSPTGKFVSTKEYPRTAWFEALVNAVCHRSYVFSGSDISIKLFEDRMLIESPGGFCPPVTSENIYEVRSARNPFLMDALYLLDYVKMAREGTRRMRESMRKLELPEPTFSQEAIHGVIVKVELRNHSQYRKQSGGKDVIRFVGAERWQTLNEDQRKIMEVALRNGQINVSETQRAIGGSWKTCKGKLLQLVEKRLLLHIHGSAYRDTTAFFMPDYRNISDRT